MTAAEEVTVLSDAFDLWFADQKLPKELRGLMFKAYSEAWMQGMLRGHSDGVRLADGAYKSALDTVFGGTR